MTPRTRALPASGRAARTPSYEVPVRRSVLPGGLRVVSEQVPGVRSVAFGIWVAVGSRDERGSQHGCSHFLEHLLFKGTRRRSALDISSVMDAVGGEMNAFTDKEYTCYYARVLDEDLPLAVDVVSDMLLHSVITAADVEVERGVILEEIAMRDDDPADLVHDVFAEAVHGDTPLGRPIIGSVESITALSRASVKRFYDTRYDLPRMVVAASGGVEHDRLVELVTAAFAEKLVGEAAPAPLRASDGGPAPESRVRREERRTEQTHLVLGTTGLSREDPRRFALSVLSGALGGGMSSRLFQSVREERGLAYSVYSYAASSADTGQFGVYAGCSASKVGQVLSLVRDELAAVLDRGLTVEEVERAKGGLRGSLVLGLEDTGSRMTRLGKGELVHAEQLSPDDVLDRIAAVTPEEVADVAREVLTRPLSLGVVGPVGRADLDKAVA